MYLTHLRLRDFRNYRRLDADFTPGFHLVLGQNAQGKTNLLEAIYLLATLRSFRGVGSAQLVRQGESGYFVGARLLSQAEHEIRLFWSPRQRRLLLDGRPVRRLTDYLGVLRAVAFCTEDLQLVKGTARIRRRFLDLLLSQTQPGYLPLLQRYVQALQSRNALLKQGRPDPGPLEGFTVELVRTGEEITRLRHALTPRLAPLAQQAYRQIARDTDPLQLQYVPSVKHDYSVELAQSKTRERTWRTTLIGPHRDDLEVRLNGLPAAQYSSEGQKRTLAIALKMAQAELLTATHGAPPILLLDDVLGELDAPRRAGLIPLLDRSQPARGQVFMTATEENWPRELSRNLVRWEVRAGTLARRD